MTNDTLDRTRRHSMQRNSILKVVNPILGILVLNQIVTGLLRGVLPRRVFVFMHEWGGLFVAAAVALHVYLNWNWVRANFFRRRPETTP